MRLDQALVARKIARSRAVATELLRNGQVRVGGAVVSKPSTQVDAGTVVEIDGEAERWVGRAAHKLVAALDAFPIAVDGSRCVDVGASTGGFTQVLLESGARQVIALDVGHGQLAPLVADDPRVIEMSGQTVRNLDPQVVGGPADVVVADLSFISVRLVLATLSALTAPDGHLMTLVKPQFEVGRERLGRAGVVSSSFQRGQVVREVVHDAVSCGLRVHGLLSSPVVGASGNSEYLVWARHTSAGKMSDVEIDRFIARVTAGEL